VNPHPTPDLTKGLSPAGTELIDRQFVTFELAGEMFAVPMAPVQEIIRVPEVARLPLAPPALEGLANLRGRVLPILSLRRIFHCQTQADDDATRALVIHSGQTLGFVVDRVCSVISVEASEMHPASSIQSVVHADYLTGLIRRERPDGSCQLLLVLDFVHLVRVQFQALSAANASVHTTHSSAADSVAVQAPTANSTARHDSSQELRLVSFTVGEQEYGIGIEDVQEIVQVPEQITGIPNAPAHVCGLMALRQRLLPLVDLRSLFHLGEVEADEHQRIVVVNLPGSGTVGLVTDTVKEVIRVPKLHTDPMPALLAQDPSLQEFHAICRLDEGRRLILVLSSELLLGLPPVQAAAALGQEASKEHDTMTETALSTDTALLADNGQDDLQLVIFRLGAEEFGVPIMSVQEIVRVPPQLTRIPKAPAFVEGVINLRGAVLPVVDQRMRLGLSSMTRNDRQRIMVFTLGHVRTGFIVDSVAEVLRVSRSVITEAPELSEEQRRLITHVARLDDAQRLVMLINPQQLLNLDDSLALQQSLPCASPDASPAAWRAAA